MKKQILLQANGLPFKRNGLKKYCVKYRVLVDGFWEKRSADVWMKDLSFSVACFVLRIKSFQILRIDRNGQKNKKPLERV